MTCPIDPNPLPCPQLLEPMLIGTNMTALRALGRPKDMEKRGAILDAAMRLFAERGVQGVPIEAIAAEAGVSKVTIYASFKDKGAILEAIVLRETARLADRVAEISQSAGALDDRLTRVGHALVAMLGDQCHLALDRCLGLEAQRNPELARRFFEAGPGHLRDILAAMLLDAAAAKEIDLTCARTAAEDLLGLWLGFSAIERRFLCNGPAMDVMESRVHRGVDLFIRAHSAAV